MSKPQTEAGRSLHGGHCRYPATCDYLAAITAIENQAVALDRAALVAAVDGLALFPDNGESGVTTTPTTIAAIKNYRRYVLALLNTLPEEAGR